MSDLPPSPALSLSLWAIRERMFETPSETLDRVKELGFSSVEVAGFFNEEASALAARLRERGLGVCSLTGPAIHKNRKGAFYTDWALKILPLFQTNTLVLHTSPRGAAEFGQDSLIRVLVDIARALQRSGITVGYHSYPHDFDTRTGKSFLSRLFGTADVPENLKLQLDTFWLNHGATPPTAYADFPVSSVHLNERDDAGGACVLGTDEPKCSRYIRPLLERKRQPVNWILENDSADGMANEVDADRVIAQCIETWPHYWAHLNGPRIQDK